MYLFVDQVAHGIQHWNLGLVNAYGELQPPEEITFPGKCHLACAHLMGAKASSV